MILQTNYQYQYNINIVNHFPHLQFCNILRSLFKKYGLSGILCSEIVYFSPATAITERSFPITIVSRDIKLSVYIVYALRRHQSKLETKPDKVLSHLWLHRISAARTDSKLAANISKAHAGAENDTSNPNTNSQAFLCNASAQHTFQSCSLQDTGAKRGSSRCRYKLWLETENSSHASQANDGGEDETGRGAINQVPKNGVGKSEGQRCLRGGLPGKFPLEKKED